MTPDQKIDALIEYLAIELARIQGQRAGINGRFNVDMFHGMLEDHRRKMRAIIAGTGQEIIGDDGYTEWQWTVE